MTTTTKLSASVIKKEISDQFGVKVNVRWGRQGRLSVRLPEVKTGDLDRMRYYVNSRRLIWGAEYGVLVRGGRKTAECPGCNKRVIGKLVGVVSHYTCKRCRIVTEDGGRVLAAPKYRTLPD